uniref:hypothetical protein n=1 Tax=Paenibacillus sp. FSL H8-0332 TaxID=2954742 RepID=UPI00403FAD01
MSLCIAVNYPGNYVMIFGDGRITRGDKVVSDSHKKLTTLNDHVSMFCSGVQDYCEELRSIVSKQVSELTSIDQIASIVMRESREVHPPIQLTTRLIQTGHVWLRLLRFTMYQRMKAEWLSIVIRTILNHILQSLL